MKRCIDSIKIFFLLGAATVISGCSDESFLPSDTTWISDCESISFRPALGSAMSRTRSGEYTENSTYEALIVNTDSDTEKLYLHTFVGDLSIDYFPMDPIPQTRGQQVNSLKDLHQIHDSFGIRILNSSDGSPYADVEKVVEISGGDGLWRPSGSPLRWPGANTLSFSAYAPAELPSTLADMDIVPGCIRFSYQTPRSATGKNDAEIQPDLLFALSECNKESSIEGSAPLTFRHALAAVKFAVRDVVDSEIISITLHNVNSVGNCEFKSSAGSNDAEFLWSGISDPISFRQDFNCHISSTSGINPEDKVLSDIMPEKTFMMIPQQIPENAEIEIKLRRRNSHTSQTEDFTLRGFIRTNGLDSWQAGKEYVYTISTSSSNWVNVFEVVGNGSSGNSIWVPSPSMDEYISQGDNGWFKVKSFRYRADDFNVREPLAWNASHGDGFQYRDGVLLAPRYDVPASDWINDPLGLKGEGSAAGFIRHDLSFLPSQTLTSWSGDDKMQANDAYAGNSRQTPWDLSKAGNQIARTTANCYVIDREGWYAIPLYYGNAIVNGIANSSAYTYSGSGGNNALKRFTNHAGDKISASQIAGVKDGVLVWQDAFNLIDKVETDVIGGEKMLLFHANRNAIQQGNAVLSVRNSAGEILWSWHIWINEHWLNSEGLSNAFSNSGFNTSDNPVSQMQEQGDKTVYGVDTGYTSYRYKVSPYNIGWCDDKTLWFLERRNTMEFEQYDSDGIKVIGCASLPILQEGSKLIYKYGNNVYFQFGRKDPFVGYLDHNNTLKPNFGPMRYVVSRPSSANATIGYAIKNPQQLFAGGASVTANDDWLAVSYVNLWNNYGYSSSHSTVSFLADPLYNGVKTVYDPCPPGYMVPPAAFFKIVGKNAGGNLWNDMAFTDAGFTNLNGYQVAGRPYTFKIYTRPGKKGGVFSLTSTGHRWYSSSGPGGVTAGGNFNDELVYLWSNHIHPSGLKSAYGLALGYNETSEGAGTSKYGVCAFFYGRKAMARPIRPIRESYTK